MPNGMPASMPLGMFRHGTIAAVSNPTKSKLAADRFRLLCAQMEDECGSQAEVAKLFGVGQPYISKLIAKGSTKEPGLGLIESAIRNQGISAEFFFNPRLKKPHFRDFRGPHKLPRVNYKALDMFLASVEGTPVQPTMAERHALERMDWDGEPTALTYSHYLSALRSVHRPADTEVVRLVPKRTER